MIQKLKAKGYAYDATYDCLKGEFNGTKVRIFIGTVNNKVWRVIVGDADSRDEGQIKIRYNKPCTQFQNNPRYTALSAEEIPDDEKISLEMSIHEKSYQASFIQSPEDDGAMNRLVWFTIFKEEYDRYSIVIYYENEFNQANGEDL